MTSIQGWKVRKLHYRYLVLIAAGLGTVGMTLGLRVWSHHPWAAIGPASAILLALGIAGYRLAVKRNDGIADEASSETMADLDRHPSALREMPTAHSELLQQNAFYASQLEAVDKLFVVIEFTLDGMVIKANKVFLDTYGYSIDEIRGQHQRMFCDPDYIATNEYAEFWEGLNNGEQLASDFMHVGAGHRELRIQAFFTPVLGNDGRPSKVIAFAVDRTQELLLQRELAEASRQAGMAEIAVGVLHNVGNVVNSANVSTTLLTEKLQRSCLKTLVKVSEVLSEHEGHLNSFLTENPQGRHLPCLLRELSLRLAAERDEQLDEFGSLSGSIEHIKELVALQQNFAQVSGTSESVDLSELLDDALTINFAGVPRNGIRVTRAFSQLPPIVTVRHKVLQILVNLISNAKHALRDCDHEGKLLTLTATSAKNSVQIQVRDNGIGIPASTLTKLFVHGFTTRKEGHGFGLHSSAMAAHELGGVLSADSDGEGKGATFTLMLPVTPDASPELPSEWRASTKMTIRQAADPFAIQRQTDKGIPSHELIGRRRATEMPTHPYK